MTFLVIKGAFHAKGAQPDGDSLRFAPDDPGQWNLVGGQHAVKRNATGAAQLRLDAIDSLETHYTPLHGTRMHQPLALARAASDELLVWVGFTGVRRDANETVTACDLRAEFTRTVTAAQSAADGVWSSTRSEPV